MDNLLAYMVERHNIYLRKRRGVPWPWTKDPVLQEFSFCNVYRELDAGTIWIRENIREPYDEHPSLWFMVGISRHINWPDTLAEVIADKKGAWPSSYKWKPERLRQILLDRKARGEKVYTGAYMLNAHGKPGDPSDKAFFTAHRVLQSVWEARGVVVPQLSVSLEAATKALMPYHGWGPFTAYEVACDLRWTRYLCDAPDKMTWANAGPGARRGLNRLAGRPVNAGLSNDQAVVEMRKLLAYISARWPKGWVPLELREIEHSLCELQKYARGYSRAKYHHK